jgi:hypothetical protein
LPRLLRATKFRDFPLENFGVLSKVKKLQRTFLPRLLRATKFRDFPLENFGVRHLLHIVRGSRR